MSSSGAATAAGRGRAGTAKRRPAPKRRPKSPPRARRPARARKRQLTARAGGLSWRGRLLGVVALLAALAAGYFLWFRDSSLVAVSDVEVVGVQSGEREVIVEELTRAAEQMSTLHLDAGRLEEIALGFPTIESIATDTSFPHGLRIEVAERPPRVVVRSGEQQAALTADGSVLPGVDPPDGLPVLDLNEVPAQGRLGGEPLEQALVAGAAPAELAPLIETVSYDDEIGVEVVLRGGIPVRFGTGARAREKWRAAAAVLADPKLDALTYLDVRVPERPSTGG
jgi:cell division protein FtsQ